MADGLRLLWSELIPSLGLDGNPNRAVYEAFDEANGRVDPMGFVHRKSLANVWNVFFERGLSNQHIRVTHANPTGTWDIDNGRHRIKVASDLGWKYIPGEIVNYRSEKLSMSRLRPSETIRQAEARLTAEWNRTREEWRDEVATRFEKDFWQPLDQSVNRYLVAVEELEEALADVERIADL